MGKRYLTLNGCIITGSNPVPTTKYKHMTENTQLMVGTKVIVKDKFKGEIKSIQHFDGFTNRMMLSDQSKLIGYRVLVYDGWGYQNEIDFEAIVSGDTKSCIISLREKDVKIDVEYYRDMKLSEILG
jgi:hypothetical protein